MHRFEMCRLAIAGDDARFEVSDLEILREGAVVHGRYA